MSKVDRNALRNLTGSFLAGYGFVSFFCFFGLVSAWSRTAPRFADPAIGAIFRHNEHGSITYFTAFQGTSAALLFMSSIPLAFLGIFVLPTKNVVWKTSRFGFSMKSDPDDPHRMRRWGGTVGAIWAPLVVFVAGPPLISWLNSLGFVMPF